MLTRPKRKFGCLLRKQFTLVAIRSCSPIFQIQKPKLPVRPFETCYTWYSLPSTGDFTINLSVSYCCFNHCFSYSVDPLGSSLMTLVPLLGLKALR
ncbi:hypothetical protein L1887_05582 [Cichorium endivia]|nr:hypothetical protein L1887_05582 [Cichorium endivia]